MGNLSEHFNYKDFTCKCPNCKGKGEYKIHLGLVGALEALRTKVNKHIKIDQAYRCDEQNEKLGGNKKSFHIRGKAAHISVDNMKLPELYKHIKEIEGIKGIGLNVKENTLHIDTRDANPSEWVKEGKDQYILLTSEKRQTYGL
ncbi:D-Ala-D-Ala carboxypeptidase family metallohydrolase [Candidatus Margulisiibacteriota bacterium]